MKLNNKFKIGEEVYTLSREAIREDCIICLGKKTITLKTDNGDREMECFKCYGVGYSVTPYKKYVVDEEAYKVSSIKANINKDKTTLKYCLTNSDGVKINRAESNISKSLEDLYKKCDELNYLDKIPQHLNFNKKALKELVDVYVCGGRVIKNSLKYMHETTNEDIQYYIDAEKVVCIENNETCTLYVSDFSVAKKFAEVLNKYFPEKNLVISSANILYDVLEDYEWGM